MTNKYELIVVGAGPGGYEAAAHAGKLGLKTLLIEKQYLGGTCLNNGCIPTKTLLASVHFLRKLKKSSLFNIKLGEPEIDFAKTIDRKNRLVQRLQKGVENLLKEANVDLIMGEAELLPGKKIKIQDKEYTAEYIILAAGTEPGDMQILKADNQKVFNSTQILELKEIQKNLLIVGGGAIGLEFADIFSSLGCRVTILDILEKILPSEDEEAVNTIKKYLGNQGVEFILGADAKDVKFDNYEKVLLAVGRKINSAFIKDPAVKKGSKQEVLVDDLMQTSVPGIYAIGDLNNLALYAHAATYQGLKVVENIKNKTQRQIELNVMPKVIFTGLQLASVGKTTGAEQHVKKLPVQQLGRAQAENQTEGFLKLFAQKASNVLEGAVIVADNAEALIGEAIVLIKNKNTLAQLSEMIHPHPTFAELFSESIK